MRTVPELDEKLLQEAMTVTGVKKKRQLLELALQEMIRHRRIERLRQRLGKTQLTMTVEDLKQMRADG
jgi:Arc/MetJ family transcription regulator